MNPAFDFQPTLTGPLVSLRPLRAQDYGALAAAAADPLIWEQHPDKRHEPAIFDLFFERTLASGGALVVLESATGTVIGTSRFMERTIPPLGLEIGKTFLARPYWGGAYNGEMKRLMLEHAFRFEDHVMLLVAPQNARSRRAVQKIGGRLQEQITQGRDRGYLVYRVDRATWGSLEWAEHRLS